MAAFLLPKEKSYFFSTANLDANSVLSSDRSKLTITLDSPIEVSAGAIDATLEVETASLWHTSPNISEDKKNNTFSYLIEGVAQPPIVIETGLYSLTSLDAYLTREFESRNLSGDTVNITGNDSTQKAVLTLNANVQVDFTNTLLRNLLGFGPSIYPAEPVPTDKYLQTGTNLAGFNTINAFTIRSDIVSAGVPINNSGLNLLAVIQIPSGSVGRQINYTPMHPTKISASELRGKRKSTFNLTMCDQSGIPVRQTEDWSILVTLREQILISDQKMALLDV